MRFAALRFSALAALLAAAPETTPGEPRERRPSEDRASFRRALEGADARGIAALEAFEAALRDAPRGETAVVGEDALRRARAERDVLEAVRPPEGLARALEEELVFFNHLVLGLGEFLGSPDTAADRERVRSVIRRARTHRQRGLDRRRDAS